MFVLDPEMIRRIMVKDFTEHFYDRNAPDWGHEIWDNLLDFLPGNNYSHLYVTCNVCSCSNVAFDLIKVRNGKQCDLLLPQCLHLQESVMDQKCMST